MFGARIFNVFTCLFHSYLPWLRRAVSLGLILLGLSACSSGPEVGEAAAFPDHRWMLSDDELPQQSRWYALYLDGQKAGYRVVASATEGAGESARHVTTEVFRIGLQQPGEAAKFSESRLKYIESATGEAREIIKSQRSATANHDFRAVQKGGKLYLQSRSGDQLVKPVPGRWRLPYGRSMLWRVAAGTGEALEVEEWSFSLRRFRRIEYQLSPASVADLPVDLLRLLSEQPGAGENAEAIHWRVERRGNGAVLGTLYLNRDFEIVADHSRTAGQALWLVLSDQANASTGIEAINHVYQRLLRSPYRISDVALKGKIRYELAWPEAQLPPETSEQHVALGGTLDDGRRVLRIDICDDCGREAAPDDAVLQRAVTANYWLTLPGPAAETALQLADDLKNGEVTRRGAMNRLTRFVTGHMNEVASYAGYATAAEAFNSAEGDCTEHALLLAALARRAGIPSRIAMGVAYNNDRFLGRRFVFVPHMWVQAWTGARWESFDSALGDFNAGYITLGLSQGEQSTYLAMNSALLEAEVLSAVQLRSRPTE